MPEADTMPVAEKATKVKKDTGKTRAPARPHKKLEGDKLNARLADAKKKLAVHKSKAILIEDKVEAYERELSLRAEEDSNA